MNKNNVWFITAKTNLHVGNENTSSYGLIDLAIQRNATTGLPCINSSSLKGALNEYAAQEAKLQSNDLVNIFGCDKTNGNVNTKKGLYTFFDANILFLPKQESNALYKLVTCNEILDDFLSKLALFSIKNNNNSFTRIDILTHFRLNQNNVVSLQEFVELCHDDNLPIIARNVLENGESKNLWYEQVLPAETVLYTLIDDKEDSTLATELKKDNAIVQIGANATIGYGYCKFTNLK